MSPDILIIKISAFGAFLSHVLIVVLIIVFVASQSARQWLKKFVQKQAPLLIFLVSFLGLIGSLLYSEFLGYPPCVLCWFQRIFLYPIVLLSFLGLVWKDRNVIRYIFALALPGALIALYHSYTQLGGHSFTLCTAVGGECAKVYVLEYGYITIPFMALTAFVWILIFGWLGKNQ